jgi:hypothetical protein
VVVVICFFSFAPLSGAFCSSPGTPRTNDPEKARKRPPGGPNAQGRRSQAGECQLRWRDACAKPTGAWHGRRKGNNGGDHGKPPAGNDHPRIEAAMAETGKGPHREPWRHVDGDLEIPEAAGRRLVRLAMGAYGSLRRTMHGRTLAGCGTVPGPVDWQAAYQAALEKSQDTPWILVGDWLAPGWHITVRRHRGTRFRFSTRTAVRDELSGCSAPLGQGRQVEIRVFRYRRACVGVAKTKTAVKVRSGYPWRGRLAWCSVARAMSPKKLATRIYSGQSPSSSFPLGGGNPSRGLNAWGGPERQLHTPSKEGRV